MMSIFSNYLSIGLLFLIYSCSTKEEPEPKSVSSPKKVTIKKPATRFIPLEIKCEQTALSDQFDMIVEARHDKYVSEGTDSCTAKLVIRNKRTKANLDSISLTSSYFMSCVFGDCDKVRSYTTSYKTEGEIIDGQYGDIVVADLNFDGKDDIAVINDCGGNGGPLYSYYLQNKNKQFVLDKFLTNEMIFFPDKIDTKRRQLKTLVHAGACCVSENIYQYTLRGKWKLVSHRILGAND